jgi:hypothetical protein
MKNTSKLGRTRTTRHIDGLRIDLSLPGEMSSPRSFNSASREGWCYSGISFSRETVDKEKVSFAIPEHEIPEHLRAYTLSVKNGTETPRVFLHFFYRMSNGHF